MNSSQAATLKAAILADPTVSSAVALHDWYSIAQVYNLPTSTQVWKPVVQAQDIIAAILPKDFAALAGNAPVSMVAMLQGGFVDATNINIQNWFGQTFSSAASSTSIQNLVITAQRPATKFESLYVVSSVSAVFGQVLTQIDIQGVMQ